jgi:hypothetical protein
MARRTGLPSLMRVAKEMCRLIAFATPIVQKLYPGNVPLAAALAAANAACEVLHAEIAVTIGEGV